MMAQGPPVPVALSRSESSSEVYVFGTASVAEAVTWQALTERVRIWRGCLVSEEPRVPREDALPSTAPLACSTPSLETWLPSVSELEAMGAQTAGSRYRAALLSRSGSSFTSNKALAPSKQEPVSVGSPKTYAWVDSPALVDRADAPKPKPAYNVGRSWGSSRPLFGPSPVAAACTFSAAPPLRLLSSSVAHVIDAHTAADFNVTNSSTTKPTSASTRSSHAVATNSVPTAYRRSTQTAVGIVSCLDEQAAKGAVTSWSIGASTLASPPPPPPPPILSRNASADSTCSRASMRSRRRTDDPDAATPALVCKVFSLYTISTPIPDDIRLTAALDRGPPYDSPVFIRTAFRPILSPAALDRLRHGLLPSARSILDTPNAGGNSENSEALSVEILAATQGLRLWAAEMQVVYQAGSPIVDYLALRRCGAPDVSVVSTAAPDCAAFDDGWHGSVRLAPTAAASVYGTAPRPSAPSPAPQRLANASAGSRVSAGFDSLLQSSVPTSAAVGDASRILVGSLVRPDGAGEVDAESHTSGAVCEEQEFLRAEALLTGTGSAARLPHPSSRVVAAALRGLGIPAAQAAVRPDEAVVAVSVTRAMKFAGGPLRFTHDDAERLLRKKLGRLLLARVGVHPAQGWSRAVLHVWSEHAHVTRVLQETLHDPARVPPALWRCTVVLLTLAPRHLMHHIVFHNAEDFALPGGGVAYDAGRHAAQVAALRHAELERLWGSSGGAGGFSR